jgi:hemoglobin/transferrin/lactoferrin receptor protein
MVRFFYVFFLFFPSLCFSQADSLTKKNLDELIVVGNRFEQNKKDAIHFISSINKTEIQKNNASTTAVLLEKNGSAFLQYSQGGGGSPVLRGFEANQIQLVLDGVRINNVIFRGGHLQNILRIDQNSLASIEILNGPGSVIYGSDALGGVISMRTNLPVLGKNIFNGFVRYATVNNEKSTHFDFNISAKKWASLTSFSFSDFGDLKMGKRYKVGYEGFGAANFHVNRIENKDVVIANPNVFLQNPSQFSQINFIQKIIFNTKKFNHSLNFQVSQSSVVPRYDRLSELTTAGLPKFARWDYGPEGHIFMAYQLEIGKVSKAFDIGNASFAYQNFKESRITRSFADENEKNQKENLDAFNVNLDFKKQLKSSTFQYGAESYLNLVNSKAKFLNVTSLLEKTANTRYPDGGSEIVSFSAYSSIIKPISLKNSLNAGFRFTRNNLKALFNDKTFFPFPFESIEQKTKAFSYSMGWKYAFSDNKSMNILNSTGFRSPNVDDIGKVFESTAGRLIVPNPNLKPEYLNNIELNTNLGFKKIQIEGAIYYSFFRNIIGIDAFKLADKSTIIYNNSTSYIYASQNLGKANIAGLQMKLKAQLAKDLHLYSVACFTQGRYIDKKPIDHIPPVHGNTTISYVKSKFNSELFFRYNGAKKLSEYALNGEDNPQFATKDGSLSWFTSNLRTSYRFDSHWQLQASIENIFDINYRTFASGISAPGRNLIFCLRYGQ